MRLTSILARVALIGPLSFAACTQPKLRGDSTSSSGGARTTSSSGTSSGGSGAGAGSSASAGTSAGSGTSAGTIGTTTGAPAPPLFVDGGYVSCELDGGVFWNCTPGTYFCNPMGSSPSDACFQCRSDADCADSSLPTYDPRKPHCNTKLYGTQNYCEECVSNADCAGNPNGNYCNLIYVFLQPPIETLGYESCNQVVNDCRVDGGPFCDGIDETCDSQSGTCLIRSGTCQRDADCDGYVSFSSPSVLEPFCSDGGVCSACPGGFCPNGSCASDLDCGSGQTCDARQCSCTDDSQCGGLSPSCIDLDGSRANDAGQLLGFCGCSDNTQCGDGGAFICLLSLGIRSCGLSCASSDFPSCDAATGLPVCDVQTQSCVGCVNDNQCRIAHDPRGPRCDLQRGGPGGCGCSIDQDCPIGEVCPPNGGNLLAACIPTLPRCTPDSCGANFCNWQSGQCVQNNTTGGGRCLDDFDCSSGGNASLKTPVCLSGICGC